MANDGEALVLWIPRPPDNANNRGHWTVANRVKRRYQAELTQRLGLRLMPGPPATCLSGVVLDSTWWTPFRRRHLDDDNAIRRLKPVIDWLVLARYLAGDAPADLHVARPTQLRATLPPDAPPLTSVRLTLTPSEVP